MLTNKQIVKIIIYIYKIKFFKTIVNVIVDIVVYIYYLLINCVNKFIFKVKYRLHNFTNVIYFHNLVVRYKK